MNIICIGHAAYDITLPFPYFPKENTKNRITKKVEGCGGSPCVAAYLLAKWGLHPYFVGTVGNDVFGNKVLKELEDVAVNTEYTEVHMNQATTQSLIVVNGETGSRTIYSCIGEMDSLQAKPLSLDVDFILMDGYETAYAKKVLLEHPNAISVLDADRLSKGVLELCDMVNYIVCSKQFLEEVTGIVLEDDKKETFIRAYRKMEEKFKSTIVVTLEAKGAMYKYQNQVKIMPAMKVKPVDTTGAGDIFHATFLYGLYKNLPFEEVIKMANIAAGLSVLKIGASASIPSIIEMRNVYHDFE